MRLNHLHFPTARLADTRAFYERYFGFERRAELGNTLVLGGEGGFVLGLDGVAPTDAAAAAPSDENPSPLHFGFCLDSPEAVRSLHARMNGNGVPIRSALRELSANAVQFYCADPAGNRVEIGWYRFGGPS